MVSHPDFVPESTVLSPGPQVYEINSSVGGRQVNAALRSAASYGFTQSNRFNTQLDERGPGPAEYYPIHQQHSPMVAFGAATRDNKVLKVDVRGWAADPGMGKQLLAGRATAPIYGFGSCPREKAGQVTSPAFKPDGTVVSPGPVYKTEASVGKQVLATKKTNPRPIIGGYAAAALEELRAFSGVSPGPAAYHVPRSTTRQLQAGKKTPPARSFGTAARFGGGGIRPSSARRIVDEPTPGPGAYNPA